VFPKAVRFILDFLLCYRSFLALLGVQFIAAAYVLVVDVPPPAVMFFLFAVSILAAVRWRGTVNGGADSMTVLVLGSVAFAGIAEKDSNLYRFCLWYLAIQTVLSYFIAGVVKVRNAEWRSGRALPAFMAHPPYEAPANIKALMLSRPASLTISWSVMLFELLFPIAFFGPSEAAVYLAVALLFHLGNCYAFGLNRFLLAWGSAYPVVYYCAAGKGL
jgi:hypothetical protein